MRKGISVTVNAAERARLNAVVANRNSPQKHVWRCRIVLLTADVGDGGYHATKLRESGRKQPLLVDEI